MSYKKLAVFVAYAASLIGFSALAQGQTPTTQQYEFSPVRIVGGGYIPAIIENACGTKYLRTDIGGAYRYDSDISQWTQMLDWVAPAHYNETGPESIGLDPNNCSMVYIAAGMYTTTNDWAFHVSRDGGRTFTTYPETTFEISSNDNGRATGERLVVNPFNSNELLFGSRHNNIQRSTNQAQTWTTGTGLPFTADTGPYGVQFVAYDPCRSNEVGCGTSGSTARVFAGEYGTTGAAGTNHGLYVSNDDGVTWALIPGQPTAWNGGTGLNLGVTLNNTGCVSAATTHPPSPQKAVIAPDGFLYVLWDDLPGPNTVCYGAVTKYDLTANATGWKNVTPPLDAVNDLPPTTNDGGGYVGLSVNQNAPLGSPATIVVSSEGRKSIANCCNVDAVYISYDGANTWTNLSAIQGSSDPNVPNTNGDDGFLAGSYYYNTSVYNPGDPQHSAPYLTFGDWEAPLGPPYTSAYFGWWLSSVMIDSFNPNTIIYSTGAMVFRTDDSNDTNPSWYLNGWGIEENAGLALASPAGPTATADPTTKGHLLSGVGDIGGFLHTNFNQSPGTGGSNVGTATPNPNTPGMFTNPVFLDTGSIDWAGQNPSFIVRAGTPISTTTSPCSSGGWSTNGGVSWTPFAACATATSGSDSTTIAADASGAEIIWGGTSSTNDQYSLNNGTTWTSTTGQPTHLNPWADKVQSRLFYGWFSSSGATGGFYSTGIAGNGTVWTRSAGQPSITTTGSCQGSGCGRVMANPYVAGDIWLPLGSNGLFHSSNFGASWTKIASVKAAYSVSVGAPAPSSSTESVFLYGTLTSATQPASMVSAIYRADDATPANASPSWIQVNDLNHQYGGATLILADSTVYGQFYMTMNGRGVILGAPTPIPAFSNLTASQTITYGKPTISVSGHLSAPSSTPPNSDNVTIAITGTSVSQTVPLSSGAFSATLNTSSVPASATPYAISYSFAGDSNFTPASNTSTTLTVNKAPLTVKANNATKTAGTANPAFTAGYTGFVNGETSLVLSGAPSLTTTATTSSPAGTYPITAAAGTLSSGNYSFTFVNGTLSIVSAAPTVTLTTTATITGSAAGGYTAVVTVTNTGTGPATGVTLSTATLAGVGATSGVPHSLGTIAAGGSATASVTFSGAGTTDGEHTSASYAGTYAGGTFSAGLRVTLP